MVLLAATGAEEVPTGEREVLVLQRFIVLAKHAHPKIILRFEITPLYGHDALDVGPFLVRIMRYLPVLLATSRRSTSRP